MRAFGKHAELPDFPRAELHRSALCCLSYQFSNEDGQWPFQLKCSILLDTSQVTRPLAQNENSHVPGFPWPVPVLLRCRPVRRASGTSVGREYLVHCLHCRLEHHLVRCEEKPGLLRGRHSPTIAGNGL